MHNYLSICRIHQSWGRGFIQTAATNAHHTSISAAYYGIPWTRASCDFKTILQYFQDGIWMPSQCGHFNTKLLSPTLFNLLPQRQAHTTALQRWACKNRQDRKCTYNVKIERVRVTIDAVEQKQVLNIKCLCILAVVIRHANSILPASYHLSPVTCWLYHIFPRYLKSHDFRGGGKLLNIKRVYWFFYNFFLKHFSL